jgi:hypothetical protein
VRRGRDGRQVQERVDEARVNGGKALPAIYTELGVGRLWYALKGVPRRRRVFAYEGEHIWHGEEARARR